MSSTLSDVAAEMAAEQAQAAAKPKTQETPTPGTPQQQRPTPVQEEVKPLTRDEIYRPAVGAAMTTIGAAFLVGGMFTGVFMPRFYATIGGLFGVGMAVLAARATRRENLVQALSLIGILAFGLLTLSISDFGAVTNLGEVLGETVSDARLHRPPAPFEVGWRAILPWALGLVGYTAAYVGTVGRKPTVGLIIPIPVIAFAAIAQPPEAEVAAGIVAFATFVIGLAIIYRADRGEGEGVSTAYELKRALRASPFVLGGIAALTALAQTGFLFPEPLYDPTQDAQLPKPIPLDAVEDRILFETQGDFSGPWRAGILAVYDGENWRLPPFSDSSFTPVPATGRVGDLLVYQAPGDVRATVTIQGLDGVVLPVPGRMNGIRAINAPQLVVDPLAETIRVETGQVEPGLNYDVVFQLPSQEGLNDADPVEDQEFLAEWTDTAGLEPPPAVLDLLARAPQSSLWQRLDFMREQLLDTVIAKGQGVPGPIPPAKVEDMLVGSQKATPYEIIAAQALIARWTGVPARIGYGFDRGQEDGETRQFRPVHGSAWLEVFFEGHGWFPVTGLPKQAEASLGSEDTVLEADILPSEDISVQLFIPLRTRPANLPFKIAQKVFLLVMPIVIAIALIWTLWPAVYKARRTSRRRQWALQQGREARIALAYAEFRDQATDLGVGDPYATPLQFLDMVVADEEHAELAWLVTRCLWGDLRDAITDDEVYAAEELSRALRRRMFEAQPFTIRGVAVVSRLSLRDPYAPELLSPPVQKVSVGKLLTAPVRAFTARRAKRKEVPGEVIGSS